MFFLVATVMLWWSPDIVMYDRGRWLSFAATGTIMLYNTILKAKFPYPTQRKKQLINFFLPTLAATAGTFPLLLLFNNTYTL